MSELNTELNSELHPAGSRSAASWAAIFAGAVGAAALSLLLLILGTGLGFSVVSPWSMEGIGASTLGFAAIAWLTFTQLAASGVGGYLAGRLRTKWTSVHKDEVYFRDTAHGFLTWAVASLLVVVVLVSATGSIVSGGVSAATEAVDNESDTLEYYVDSLFRADYERSDQDAEVPVGEVTRIFAQGLRKGSLEQEDERHIGQLIAQRSNLSQREAEQRVSEGFNEVQTTLEEMEATAREAADEARKASAYAALWMFVALLVGAFVASLMAIFGGRQRDAA